VTGLRPTGHLHLGNYLGAIRNTVALQEKYQCYVFVADVHAVTEPEELAKLSEHTLGTVATYIACGLDPARTVLFAQSHVHAQIELAQYLRSMATMAQMNNMVQFKEKSATRAQENINVALFDYPCLMAGDILAYNPDLVPVGSDQRQHLELARLVAKRFNRTFGTEKSPILAVPEALTVEETARIKSLTDGSSKMSKSDPSDQSRINLLDAPEVITRKIKRAKSDAIVGLSFDDARPEAANLLGIYQAVTGKSREEVLEECQSINFGTFKPRLADALIAHLQPIQKRYAEIGSDKAYLSSVLKQGRERAEAVAQETLGRVKTAMNFVPAA
jgi:tryptophanyl-tRNA synthetase